MKKRTLYLISILLLFGCKPEPISEAVYIDPASFINTVLLLSDYVDNLRYLKLSPEIIFGEIYHLELSDENIFLGTDQGLLVFDFQGCYKRKIGNIGNAPMEYQHSMDFSIDCVHKIIYLRDIPYIKLYSFEGDYLRSIKVSGQHVKTVYDSESLYLFPLLLASTNPTEYFWKQIDLNGNIKNIKENHTIKFDGEGMTYRSNYAYKNSQFIGYWNQYCDTVYRITEGVNSTGFVWTKGSFRLTPTKNIADNDNHCLILNTVFETNNLLYMQYRTNGKRNICIYDKKKKHFINQEVLNKKGITNDIDGGITISPQYLSSVNGCEYFIQCIYPDILIDHDLEKKMNLFDEISPDDNQILIFAKLKD